MNTEFLIAGVVWYVVFLLSTTCHEAAHAFVAKLGGDLTAFHGGQATLDPLPHIRREPFGMVLFPVLSYAMGGWMMGWASAPYDPLWSLRYPRRAAWMSLAGPGANYSLAILAAIPIHVGMWTGLFVPGTTDFMHVVEPTSTGIVSGAAMFLSLMFSLNLLLGTFNLLPVPPLDGFSAIGLLLPETGARRFQELGHSMRGFTIVGLMIAWRVFEPIFNPLFTMSLSVLYPGQSYGGQ